MCGAVNGHSPSNVRSDCVPENQSCLALSLGSTFTHTFILLSAAQTSYSRPKPTLEAFDKYLWLLLMLVLVYLFNHDTTSLQRNFGLMWIIKIQLRQRHPVRSSAAPNPHQDAHGSCTHVTSVHKSPDAREQCDEYIVVCLYNGIWPCKETGSNCVQPPR